MRLAATAIAVIVASVLAIVAAGNDDEPNHARTDAADTTSSQRTRLVGEPVLLRFTGPGAYVKYTIIFRLSRDPKRRRAQDPRDQNPRLSATSRGNYKLAKDIIFAADAPIFVLGQGSAKHCFHGVLPSGRYADLDRRPQGSAVRFVAQPLDFIAGADKLGRRYVTKPLLLRTDMQITGRAARQALRRLGCLANALQEYAAS
jgi:hypothetical protein